MPVVYQSLQECRNTTFGETGRGILEMVDQYASRGIENITSVARGIYDNASRAYTSFMDSYAVSKMNAAVNHARHYGDRDIIRPLYSIDELQQAKNRMQRGIMCNPILRQLSRDNRIEGYRDSYNDLYRHLAPEDHPDYRRVTNGVWMEGEDDTISYRIDLFDSNYDDNDHDDPFNDLTIVEKDYILRTSENALAYFMQNRRDPTSKWNASL